MKQASSEIFDLVKSMTKTEKRFFKLYAARHFSSENQYLRLFDRIDKQADYNEKELSRLFSGNKSPAHFAVIKKQLYENILEALHRYDEFAQREQKIRKGIHYCELLLKRGLYDQCARQVKKYKQMANRYEKFEHLSELIEIEKKLINKKQFATVSYDEINALQEEQDTCLKQLQLTGDYWRKSNRIYKLQYEKKMSPGRPHPELEQLVREKQFASINEATTFKAKLDFLQVNALHAFVNNDIKKAYSLNSSFLELMDEHEHLKLVHADRYFSVLNNYLIDSLILKKYDKLKTGIRTLRELPSKPEFRHLQNLEANVFRQSYLLEMNYYISTEQFELAEHCIPVIEAGLKKFTGTIALPNKVTLRYLMAYTLFCRRDFKKCLDHILFLLKIKDADTITDLYRDARIMQVLCHFELGDYLLVESMITSLQRSVLHGKTKQLTYKELLRYLRQSVQKLKKPDKKELQHKMEFYAADQQESHLFNNFNYVYWAASITKQLK